MYETCSAYEDTFKKTFITTKVIRVPTVTTSTLASEVEADKYLKAVLENREYRSMGEIEKRTHDYIKDPRVRSHFIQRAKELIGT